MNQESVMETHDHTHRVCNVYTVYMWHKETATAKTKQLALHFKWQNLKKKNLKTNKHISYRVSRLILILVLYQAHV